ncbi:MAG: hypothetical protein JWP88_2322 [Flaviaesturariibacter sp.]|nr:hypothetical protein [Flaviaesturariibacter sp.]
MKVTLHFDTPSDLVDFIDEIVAPQYKPLPAGASSITGTFREAEIELARNAYYAQVDTEAQGAK